MNRVPLHLNRSPENQILTTKILYLRGERFSKTCKQFNYGLFLQHTQFN